MVGTRAQQLIARGNGLFGKKCSLDSLHQEIAENFYPQRADFTRTRWLGEEFAQELTTSYPVIAHRTLSDSISTMLRPRSQQWFDIYVEGLEEDNTVQRWLEDKAKIMRRAMYDPRSQFVRAAKEGDADFSAFGQCCISKEINRTGTALLYRCWHLRDMAWAENDMGEVDEFHRKWKNSARNLVATFGADRLHRDIVNCAEKDNDAHRMFEFRHVVLPVDQYPCDEGKFKKYNYVSAFIDVENQKIVEEIGAYTKYYTLPRWQTVSGSQYAFSPATVAALPDARLIQAMTLTLLEAGEKAVSPPLIATQDAIRSDIALYAGAITYVDSAYDERLGDVLRPIAQNNSAIPLGLEMTQDTRAMIHSAFYLDRINMPAAGGDMTAYEVSQRIQEYIRNALPLFEPIEQDYNGGLCYDTFQILMRFGTFGSVNDMPDALSGRDIEFKFNSPLVEADGKEKGNRFLETKAMLAEAASMDQGATAMFDVRSALRDTLEGIGCPSKWIHDEQTTAEIEEQLQEMAQQTAMLNSMEQSAGIAKNLGDASVSMTQAGNQA